MAAHEASGRFGREDWEVASTGRRTAAWFLDLVLLSLLVSAAAVGLGAWHATTRSMVNDDGSTWTASTYYLDQLWFYTLLAAFSVAYSIVSWRIGGATPAQRLLGLRVLDATEPRLVSWPRSAVRWFALFGWTFVGAASNGTDGLTLAAALWLVVLLISQVGGDGRQGYHDRLARSLVVRRRLRLPPAWD